MTKKNFNLTAMVCHRPRLNPRSVAHRTTSLKSGVFVFLKKGEEPFKRFFAPFQELVMDRKPKPAYVCSLTGCITIFLKFVQNHLKFFIQPITF
jgi:hypothetical protein